MKKIFGVCKLSCAVLFFSALVLGGASPVYGQWRPIVKGTAKTAAKRAPAAATSAKAAATVAATKSAPAAQKAMSEDSKRFYYSLLTKVGVSKRKALNYLYKHGAQPSRYPMPRLSGETLVMQHLKAPSKAQDWPAYPFSSPKGVFYRGISIKADGLRNILQNGLRAKDSGTHHSDFTIMTYQTKALVDMANQMVGDSKNICLISDAARAESYAVRRSKLDGDVPLVIQVRSNIPVQRNRPAQGYYPWETFLPTKLCASAPFYRWTVPPFGETSA